MDTKDLSDIPNYGSLMHQLVLPRYQFTIRDECTGVQFLSFGSECCTFYGVLAIKRLLEHFKAKGVTMDQVVLRTDNGTEYTGNRLDHSETGFVHAVEIERGATHHFNRVGRPNDNADVESVHHTIEREFYELEGQTFTSLDDFLAKASIYQHYYNLARLNYSKGKKSPLDILEERQVQLGADDPTAGISKRIFLLPPVVYGNPPKHRAPQRQVGQDVAALAGCSDFLP